MIERNLFNVLYHPIIDLTTGMWVGAESQLYGIGLDTTRRTDMGAIEGVRGHRVQHPTRWICREVVKDFAESFWACENLYISICLSAEDVLNPKFSDFINQLISKYKVSASCIAFELKFSASLAAGRSSLAVKLKHLRAQGYLIVLHNFAPSDCSVSALESLPVDVIKIDKAMMVAMNCHQVAPSLPLLLKRARMLDIDVVFTDVRTDMQAKRIRDSGGTTAQGQLYSKALGAHDFTRAYFTRPHPCRLNVI